MSKDIQNKNCSSGKFKRLNYYEGMLLTEQDFKAEQNYFRDKMKLHNRLHGYGVVWGLEVTKGCIKEGDRSAEKIFIEPGFALDCAGNEIVVCHPYRVPLDEKIDELLKTCKPIKERICLSVSIKYCEGESEPQPQYIAACEEDEMQVKMSRICEGFCVELLPKKETDDCCQQHPGQDCNCEKTYRQDCLGVKDCCEDEYGIILGCICIEQKKKGQECEHEELPEAYVTRDGSESESDKEITNQERALEKEFISYGSLQVFIDPCCKPPQVCRPCASPQEKWEHHKQQLMEEICKTSGAIDLTCLIGKPVIEAEECLNSLGYKDSHKRFSISLLGDNPGGSLFAFQSATSCAYPGSRIVLITDEKESCILFAASFHSSEYTDVVSELFKRGS